MALIYLVWMLVRDLQVVNREISLAVHFPPSTKHIILMPFGVDFEGLQDQSSEPCIFSNRKEFKNLPQGGWRIHPA